VELYTPLSAHEVEQIERGEGFADGTWYFVDKPDPDEANDDAVWVIMEIPEAEVVAYEDPRSGVLGYREFGLPAELATRFPVHRASSV
jgi:hypothetical protein